MTHFYLSDKIENHALTSEFHSTMAYPSLPDLDVFVSIVRHRSFQAAALERGVSRSALSHTMRSLEEQLGIRLLNRTTRSVTPTEAGLSLLVRLEPALLEITQALDEIKYFQDTPIGKLRLNVPRPAARLLLASFLAKFTSAHPHIQVEIVTDDSFTDVIGEGFDAGIRFKEDLSGDMIAIPIGKPLHFVVVASPQYLKKQGEPKEPSDLKAHACICRRFPDGNQYIWEFKGNKKPLNIHVKGTIIVDDDELMIQAAVDGAGIAYVYEAFAQEAISSGKLITILNNWYPLASPFFLYYPSRRQMPPVLRAFINAIKQ